MVADCTVINKVPAAISSNTIINNRRLLLNLSDILLMINAPGIAAKATNDDAEPILPPVKPRSVSKKFGNQLTIM